MILVDTDICIDFFAGRGVAAQALEQLFIQQRAFLSAITVFELFAGVTARRRIEQIETLTSTVHVLAITLAAARLAGELYTRLKSEGKLIGNNDLFLAASALELDIPLMTRNRRHFSRIADLTVLDPWEILAAQ